MKQPAVVRVWKGGALVGLARRSPLPELSGRPADRAHQQGHSLWLSNDTLGIIYHKPTSGTYLAAASRRQGSASTHHTQRRADRRTDEHDSDVISQTRRKA
ncbi:hypothetical protein E2C01_081519 [Portunus trituberculatus]|uniref:Uncharacterized protein n=1 Tax=Portunus trituberculatus TaxID=210409 RepID=A0A5B7IWK2_PORTR|nr:hypothetical protein [Portunus trituberculatus]